MGIFKLPYVPASTYLSIFIYQSVKLVATEIPSNGSANCVTI